MSEPRHVAHADCERIRPGWIAQPANAISSLAFVAAAVPLVRSARARRRPAWAMVAIASAVEGVGSVGFHGPGGRRAKAIHDAGLVALVATTTAALVTDEPPRASTVLRTGALGLAALVTHARSRSGGPWCSRDSLLQGHAVFHVLAAAALVSAAPSTTTTT